MDFGDFDDDLFDNTPKKKADGLNDAILNYKPKIVEFKV